MSLDSFIFFPPLVVAADGSLAESSKKKKKKRTSLSSGRPSWPSVISRRLRPSLTQSDGQSVGRTDGQTSSHHPCVFVFPGGKTDGHRLSRRPFSLPSLSSPPPLQPLPDLFCLFPILSSHGWRARAAAPPALCEAAKRFVFAETCASAIDLLLIGAPVTFPLTLQSVKKTTVEGGEKKQLNNRFFFSFNFTPEHSQG